MTYLNNNICVFTPLKPIDYEIKKNLFITSLFKMSTGSYKNFDKYLEGIQILNNVANDENMEIRMFIDDTILQDDEIMKFLNSLNKITLVSYECTDFKIGKHHVGLFGTIVRFFPMFDFENNDANRAFIVDADTTYERLHSLLNLNKSLGNIKYQNDLYISYIGRYFHISMLGSELNKILYNKKWYYFPYCIAQRIIGIKKIPSEPLIKYINKLALYMDEKTRPSKILTDYYIDPKMYKIKCQNNICFGVDEYFLNRILFKFLLTNNMSFCYNASFDYASFFYFKHPSIIDFNYVSISKHEYIKIFNEYMKKIGLYNIPFNELDKKLYMTTNFDCSKNTNVFATPFMKNYSTKMVKLLKYIIEKKDYRIYTKSEIYNLLEVDCKKFYKVNYIKFINIDIPTIINGCVKFKSIVE